MSDHIENAYRKRLAEKKTQGGRVNFSVAAVRKAEATAKARQAAQLAQNLKKETERAKAEAAFAKRQQQASMKQQGANVSKKPAGSSQVMANQQNLPFMPASVPSSGFHTTTMARNSGSVSVPSTSVQFSGYNEANNATLLTSSANVSYQQQQYYSTKPIMTGYTSGILPPNNSIPQQQMFSANEAFGKKYNPQVDYFSPAHLPQFPYHGYNDPMASGRDFW